MARLIDVDPIIERFSGGDQVKTISECAHDERFVRALKEAPTVDAVEVVRCKNCKYREDRLYCRLRKQPVIVTNVDFCSYGERSEKDV